MSYTTGIELKKRKLRGIPLNEALSRTYIVKAGSTSGQLHLPKCLVGKRIKLVLVRK